MLNVNNAFKFHNKLVPAFKLKAKQQQQQKCWRKIYFWKEREKEKRFQSHDFTFILPGFIAVISEKSLDIFHIAWQKEILYLTLLKFTDFKETARACEICVWVNCNPIIIVYYHCVLYCVVSYFVVVVVFLLGFIITYMYCI